MTQHVLIGQVYDAFVASEVKLSLMEKHAFDHPVTIVTAAGSFMIWTNYGQFRCSNFIGRRKLIT